VTINQITSTPPKFAKAPSLYNKQKKKPSYIKLETVASDAEGKPINFKDGYETFLGFPKISEKDLRNYRQQLKKRDRETKERKNPARMPGNTGR